MLVGGIRVVIPRNWTVEFNTAEMCCVFLKHITKRACAGIRTLAAELFSATLPQVFSEIGGRCSAAANERFKCRSDIMPPLLSVREAAAQAARRLVAMDTYQAQERAQQNRTNSVDE